MPSSEACILGIDTALRRTGYGVIRGGGGRWTAVEHGVIRNPKERPKGESLRHLAASIAELLRRHAPSAVAVEGIFHCRNARTALTLGEARGAVLLTCAAAGTDVFEYSPREVKRAVTGRGQAQKAQVVRMVAAMLGLPPALPEDAADGLALALCHAHSIPIRSLFPAPPRGRYGTATEAPT